MKQFIVAFDNFMRFMFKCKCFAINLRNINGTFLLYPS